MSKLTQTTLEIRLWEKTILNEATGCWVWTAALFKNGYGSLKIAKRQRLAHRGACELWWGVTLPRWLQVCHDCPGGDNKRCCNPAHLFLADAKGHSEDKVTKGQMAKGDRNGARLYPERLLSVVAPERMARGERHARSKLTTEQVTAIRVARLTGETYASIANRYGVHPTLTWKICNGQMWNHVKGPSHATRTLEGLRTG